MLINQEWSTPQKLTYGKNVTLQYSKPGFTVKVFNHNGSLYEKQVQEGREFQIRAVEIMSIPHPMITLKSDLNPEIHVHVECPMY